jgi:hypothetical protein
VFLGNFGTREQLLAAIERARLDAEELLAVADAVAADYATGTAEGQPHVHVRALIFDFLWHQAVAIRDWAERAAAEVEGWDDVEPAGKTERALERIARLAAS